MHVPRDGDTWIGLTAEALPVDAALAWAGRPDCGAVVLFIGTVRDHSEGRPGVSGLEYEAYEKEVEPGLAAVADDARARWPVLGRLVLLHRVGPLAVGDPSVVVVASAPHRPEAFEVARFCIDELKATAPIWKRERWDGGEAWGLGAHDLPTGEWSEGQDARRPARTAGVGPASGAPASSRRASGGPWTARSEPGDEA